MRDQIFFTVDPFRPITHTMHTHSISTSMPYTEHNRAHGPYTMLFKLCKNRQYALPYYLLDSELHCISIDLWIDHHIPCSQPAYDQLEFESQRDLDFAYLLLSSREHLHISVL